jgi:hypothetical protein
MDRGNTMKRGVYTPPFGPPKTSSERNRAAMDKVLEQVTDALELYDKAVHRARNLQARHIVDALFGRWQYQVVRGNTELSFGEWLLEKRNLQGTYARLTAPVVLWDFTGVVKDTRADKRFRLFGEQLYANDWLTPLIQHYVNRRIEADNYIVRLTSYTEPFTGYNEALSSFSFVRDWVVSKRNM